MTNTLAELVILGGLAIPRVLDVCAKPAKLAGAMQPNSRACKNVPRLAALPNHGV
jgi:hypothetical protein